MHSADILTRHCKQPLGQRPGSIAVSSFEEPLRILKVKDPPKSNFNKDKLGLYNNPDGNLLVPKNVIVFFYSLSFYSVCAQNTVLLARTLIVLQRLLIKRNASEHLASTRPPETPQDQSHHRAHIFNPGMVQVLQQTPS